MNRNLPVLFVNVLKNLPVLFCFVILSVQLKILVSAKDAESNASYATYLANEGVMISSSKYKVLFDPFFHNDFGHYSLVPETIRDKIFKGLPPYDNIDAVFISHAHEDHFSAVDVNRFLSTHQDARLFAPEQAVLKLRNVVKDKSVFDRVITVSLDYSEKPWRKSFGELVVEAVRIPHAGGESRKHIENIVFRVSLDHDVTVIHMGDAEPKTQHFEYYDKHWNKIITDLALPPYWFFASRDGRNILNKTINSKRAIGVHVPSTVPLGLAKSGFEFFSIPGEKREIMKELQQNVQKTDKN